MSKLKTAKKTDFWERNRKSGGYLLRKTVMGYGVSICYTAFRLVFPDPAAPVKQDLGELYDGGGSV